MSINPDTLNDWLKLNGGYDIPIYTGPLKLSHGNVIWSSINYYPGGNTKYIGGRNAIMSLDSIDLYLSMCKAVIVEIKQASGNYHWILAIGKENAGYRVIDPLSGTETLLPAFTPIYSYQVYELK